LKIPILLGRLLYFGTKTKRLKHTQLAAGLNHDKT